TLPDLTEQGRRGLGRLQAHLRPILRKGDAWMLLARYLFKTSALLRPILASPRIAAQQQLLALYQLLQFSQGQAQKLEAGTGAPAQAAFLAHLRFLLLCGEARIT